MERLRRIIHAVILPGLLVLMFAMFTVQASAATIRIEVRNVKEASSAVTVTDGEAYSVRLNPSTYYTFPKAVVVQNSAGEVVPVSYDPKTGELSISGDYVYGNLTVTGESVAVQPIDQPIIEGDPIVSETLSVKVSPEGADVTYQWYREKNGVRTAVGNTATYELTAADVGYTIEVVVINNLYDEDKKTDSVGPVEKRKALDRPANSDVKITHVSTNGGSNGSISPNTDRILQYYDKTISDWVDLRTPVRNLMAGEYQIRFKETDIFKESNPIIVTVLEPCSSPVITDVTVTHLTEAGASTGKLASNTSRPMEYSADGVTWELLPVSGLKAGVYWVRFQATISYLQSAPAEFPVMEPSKLTITPADISVTHVTVKGAATGILKAASTGAPTMEVLVDGVWKTLPLRTVKAGTYQVRYAATKTTFPSASCNVIVKEPADVPTGIRISDVSEYGGNTGSISGLKTAWQFSYDGKTWNDCTQTSLTGLSAGAYYFRTKETETNLPSEAVKYFVKQPDATPQATIDYVNGTLKNLVADAEYLIDSAVYKASANGTISILDNELAGKSIALKRKGNGETTLDSAKQTLDIPARPAMPATPVIVKKTDTTVTVTVVAGLEYSINGTTWLTPVDGEYTFTGLKANTAYTVYARVKAVEGKSFSSANAGANVTTKKSSSDAVAPTKAVASAITDTTITVDVVSGQEYRLNSGEWIRPEGSTYQFTGLKQTTRYTVYTRTAETEDTMASSYVTSSVTTYTKHTIGPVTIDFFKMAIVDLAPGSYSINNGSAIEVGKDGLLDVEDYFGRTIQLRRLGSVESKMVDSDPLSVDVISPIAAPTEEQVNMASVRATLTGFVVTEPNVALEYQILDMDGKPLTEWKSSVEGEDIVFDGLQHSTAYLMQISFMATETDPKSNAYISDPIYTLFYEETPAAKVDTIAHCLTGLVPNASYLVNGTAYVATAQGTIAVSDMWIGSEALIVKCGDGVKTVDSTTQSLMLPERVPTQLNVTVRPVTYYDGSNGAITGLTTDMEYSLDGGKTWTAVAAQTLENLSVSNCMIRYRAQADRYFAGEAKTVAVALDEVVAAHKKQTIEALEKIYEDMASSLKYNEAQLEQLRTILDDGIENIKVAMATVADVDNAKDTVCDNMEQVPCANMATVDGKLVGENITSDTQLQYPEDSTEIWGNVANEDGLDSDLAFVIQILGKSDTEMLNDRFLLAANQGTVTSTDSAIDAEALKSLLHNTEVKLALDITLARDAAPTDQFKGVYRVTVMLPEAIQGIDVLNVISVGEDGAVSYHPATVTGNYLTFETTHFSIYGVIGEDTLAAAKEETLQKISKLSEQPEPDEYTRDNWDKLENAFLTAINKVTDAKTEDEVAAAWDELLNTLEQTPVKRSLGWLWLLMLILVLLIALIIVCYLVWQVHYFDAEDQIHQCFHFWGTKIKLWTPEKDGFVLAGWYYDSELTDPAEENFKMPWHSVKLYAKWNMIEILPEPEDEEVEDISEENVDSEEETVVEEIVEQESEEIVSEEELPALGEADEERKSEEEYLSEAEEEINEDDLAELALLDEPAQEDEPAQLNAAENEGVALLTAPEEDDTSETEVAALPEAADSGVAMLEAPEDENVALLEAAEEETLPLLEAPEQNDETLPIVIVGDTVDDSEPAEDAPAEDDYKDSDSYRAWLLLGDGESEQASDEEEKMDDGDEVQLFVNEKTGEKYHIRFNLSFRAKMTSLPDDLKGFYRELKDEFLTYKGVKTRISWKAEAVRKGRETIARFAVRDRTLCVFLALDPNAYRDSKYVFESVQDIKAYEAVPMLIRVKSDLSCRKVKELIADMMEPREVKRLDAAPETDYSYLDEDSSTEARLRAGQLRIWAEGPDDQVCANRAAAATLHYLISPEATAEEAEELISDEMLDALMPPAQDILIVPDQVGEVSLEQLCKKFYVGDTVDVAAMKEKGLLDPEVNYVKITSEGDMTKRLTVQAHMFERTAAKMILLTGGDVEVISE